MRPTDLLELPEGKIGFSGSVRGDLEPSHEIFRAVLPGRRELYGEWIRAFQNDSDFDVKVVSFGFLDKYLVENTHLPMFRVRLSDAEKLAVRRLWAGLVKSQEAASVLGPFRSGGEFPGKIEYCEDWAAGALDSGFSN